MEPFCIDRSVVGTADHVVVDGDSTCRVTEVPSAMWHLDGAKKGHSDTCLDTALALGPGVPVLDPPAAFVRQADVLAGSLVPGHVPWGRMMPAWAHEAFVRRLTGEVAVAMAAAPLDYYRKVWVPGNGIFRSLQRCSVDSHAWGSLLALGEGNVSALASFEPDAAGLAQPVSYDRLRTLTGRLTVTSGPQILTLKRVHRRVVRSVYGSSGSVVALDFAALEARILLYEHGRRCEELDLYGMIARELGYERNAIKGAVISKLYGSSKHALGRHLGIGGVDLDTFIRKVQVYFDTDELLARVKAQFVATGRVNSRHGRPVVVDEPTDNVMVAYYGQATGVDITMLGFRQVVDRLASEVPRVRPVFLLHDAILLDVHDDDLPAVRRITHLKVPGYVQRFVLRLEEVSR